MKLQKSKEHTKREQKCYKMVINVNRDQLKVKEIFKSYLNVTGNLWDTLVQWSIDFPYSNNHLYVDIQLTECLWLYSFMYTSVKTTIYLLWGSKLSHLNQPRDYCWIILVFWSGMLPKRASSHVNQPKRPISLLSKRTEQNQHSPSAYVSLEKMAIHRGDCPILPGCLLPDDRSAMEQMKTECHHN